MQSSFTLGAGLMYSNASGNLRFRRLAFEQTFKPAADHIFG